MIADTSIKDVVSTGSTAMLIGRGDVVGADRDQDRTWDYVRPRCEILRAMFNYTGCFNALLSTGILRSRFPVAAKIALAMAGTIAEVPVSPIPPGGSTLLTM
jgi:hypothetical protein